jgi:hypothetical protein
VEEEEEGGEEEGGEEEGGEEEGGGRVRSVNAQRKRTTTNNKQQTTTTHSPDRNSCNTGPPLHQVQWP